MIQLIVIEKCAADNRAYVNQKQVCQVRRLRPRDGSHPVLVDHFGALVEIVNASTACSTSTHAVLRVTGRLRNPKSDDHLEPLRPASWHAAQLGSLKRSQWVAAELTAAWKKTSACFHRRQRRE
jgi:hypothetical protein